MATASEAPVWSGTPSQYINFGRYTLCITFCWLIVPLFMMLWWWIEVKCTQYELSSQRLRMRAGVLNKDTNDLELYRIKDVRLEQPLALRMFGLANLVLDTSDRSHPQIRLHAIPDAESLMDELREHVERLRIARGIREIDMH
jgi:uncharacterized membrane protein YdbT with pleckstrin-like domain